MSYHISICIDSLLLSGTTCPTRLLEWFCGFKEAAYDAHPKRTEEDRKAVMKMLYEPPRTKLLLNCGLFLVCSLGIFLFVYFSV
ncbi:hypothetical protein DPEC_G00363210 [Dallia pectoralis]|nr:hypothetical protein DPEC_G00363210 [Dallia pectoralis]